MPILPWGAPPGSSGSSPLTTKGDLYAYGASVTRLPVVYDGIPLQSASAQPVGLGYGTQSYNFNNQLLTNFLGTTSSPALTSVASGTTYGISYTPSISGATNSDTVYTGYFVGTIAGGAKSPNVAGGAAFFTNHSSASVLSNGYGGQFQFNNAAGTTTNAYGSSYQINATGGTITSAIILQLNSLTFGGAITTCVGLSILNLGGTTKWGIQCAYNTYFSALNTFGGTANPSFVVDVQGGNAATNAIGITPSTVAPSPAASVGAISLYQGTAGNKYFMVTYNDAGTTRYKYVILDTTGITWTEGTSLPT